MAYTQRKSCERVAKELRSWKRCGPTKARNSLIYSFFIWFICLFSNILTIGYVVPPALVIINNQPTLGIHLCRLFHLPLYSQSEAVKTRIWYRKNILNRGSYSEHRGFEIILSNLGLSGVHLTINITPFKWNFCTIKINGNKNWHLSFFCKNYFRTENSVFVIYRLERRG